MKICKTCKRKLEVECFYVHKQMGDGRLNICIDCTKERIAKHRELNIEKVRAYDRKRGRTEERLKISRERAKKYKDRYKHLGIKWKERNPEKRAAHILLGSALKCRRIFKLPCEVCGELKVDAHHDDYTKPLEVRWLCKKHHMELHRRYKE